MWRGEIEPSGYRAETLVSSESRLKIFPQVTANELLGQALKEPEGLSLNTTPLLLAELEGQKTSEYTLFILAALNGAHLNRVFFSIAPYKNFGLDKYDILNDWQMPDRNSEESRRLLEIHGKTLKSWRIFETHRRFLRGIIEKGEQSTLILPAIRWQRTNNSRRWLVGTKGLRKYSGVLDMSPFVAKEHPGSQPVVNSLVGLLVVAHFSPEITSEWPQRMELVGGRRTQVIGPTQVPVLALERRQQLFGGKFMQQIEQYSQGIPSGSHLSA